MTQKTRTRFAPSPTGFIHLGNIRSALYPWAFARATGGVFILRIEDTDLERSSQAAVDVIIEGMRWLGLDYDEGPYYQMQRMDRYKAVLAVLQAAGQVYPCYMSVAGLDALRERQMAQKLKPRYDGTWRPEPGKTLPPVPAGVQPVMRFRNPQGGSVVWDDKVKGRIEISNDELDDLVIARPDGTPTYNFCVVVDDIDMAITHVIRGDDHINNTPRQINIFRALGKDVPVYAHLPTVLNEQGEKMSKRHGAKAVTQYAAEGYLPDAMVNYLARLGWSHGDDEIFSREQFLQWFNLDHLGKSAAQFDEAKLRWVNAQHMKAMPDDKLAELVLPFLGEAVRSAGPPQASTAPSGGSVLHEVKSVGASAVRSAGPPQASTAHSGGSLDAARRVHACALLKDRCSTLVELADWMSVLVTDEPVSAQDIQAHVPADIAPAVARLAELLASCEWSKAAIAAAIKQVLAEAGLKMPQLAMPVRVLIAGRQQTPSLDAFLALMDQENVIARLGRLKSI